MKKQLVSEIKQFQKLAGLLKEYIESDPETITQAFQQAGIELDKPVVYICDYGNPGGTDKPVKVLGGKLLQELEAERKRDEEDNPDYNEEEGITYEYGPHQGGGELLGDYTPEAVKGLKCKLNIYFSDSHLYEIWQAEEVKETWHPDDPSHVDLDDIEDKDPDDYDDISEEEGEGTDYDESSDSESDDTDAMGGIDEEEGGEYEKQLTAANQAVANGSQIANSNMYGKITPDKFIKYFKGEGRGKKFIYYYMEPGEEVGAVPVTIEQAAGLIKSLISNVPVPKGLPAGYAWRLYAI